MNRSIGVACGVACLVGGIWGCSGGSEGGDDEGYGGSGALDPELNEIAQLLSSHPLF